MRMLRWMCGVTELVKIRHERIRVPTKVGEITKKVRERIRIRISLLSGTKPIPCMRAGTNVKQVINMNVHYKKK